MTGVCFLPSPGNSAFVSRCVGAKLPSMVSLVGAGGKTSTLFWLAQTLAAGGQRVLVTTTTRMLPPDPKHGATVLIEPEFAQRLEALRGMPFAPGVVALFSRFDVSEGKVIGCEPDEIDKLKSLIVADVILVEADGARHCALKAPAAHEPCIPRSSNTVIALSGAAPLGCPANPDDIHRWPQFAAITGLCAGDLIEPVALGRLLEHPEGMFKDAPPHAARHWLVNTQGTHDASVPAMLAQLAHDHPELDGIWIGDMRQSSPFSHAWVRA
ncbi:MAG: putative selenium-dependent hydroxylase accessory protein YqeC [Rhodoferax sp.]|jgi:probable selenium-dependent hydroxylase accessory protein YqeC|nr:putative selenium-dependent hydroxylase accessory protein YqeC [Rhodoferax sp.]